MKPNLTKIYLAVASFAEGVMPILEALAKVSRGLASEPEAVAQPEAPSEPPAPKKRGPNKPKARTFEQVIEDAKKAYPDETKLQALFEELEAIDPKHYAGRYDLFNGDIRQCVEPEREPLVIVTREDETAGIIEQIATEALQETPTEVSASTHDKDSLLALCKPISGGTFDGAAEARKELTQLVKKYGGTISKMDPKHYDAFAAEAEAMIKQYVK